MLTCRACAALRTRPFYPRPPQHASGKWFKPAFAARGATRVCNDGCQQARLDTHACSRQRPHHPERFSPPRKVGYTPTPLKKSPLTLSAVGFKIAPRMEALRPKVGIAPIIRTFFVVIFARHHTRGADHSTPPNHSPPNPFAPGQPSLLIAQISTCPLNEILGE